MIDSSRRPTEFKSVGEKKMFFASQFAYGMEFVRSMIDHKKVLVLALNGPGVGAGASWFQGVCDIFYAAEGAWLQVTFSQLGLIPETGAAVNWAHSIGVHRANDWLIFGGKATVEELKEIGLVNQIFPKEGFHDKVKAHLKEILKDRSGKAMMEAKRMQNAHVRDQRILALFDAWNSLAERFVDGEPAQRMKAKAEELQGKSAFCATCPFWCMFMLTCRSEAKVENVSICCVVIGKNVIMFRRGSSAPRLFRRGSSAP